MYICIICKKCLCPGRLRLLFAGTLTARLSALVSLPLPLPLPLSLTRSLSLSLPLIPSVCNGYPSVNQKAFGRCLFVLSLFFLALRPLSTPQGIIHSQRAPSQWIGWRELNKILIEAQEFN